MTLDRDVRLTADEITQLQHATRAEIARAVRSITTAEAARARGNKIQAGTLQRHYERLEALRHAADKLEAARRAIAHRIAETVAPTTEGDPNR